MWLLRYILPMTDLYLLEKDEQSNLNNVLEEFVEHYQEKLFILICFLIFLIPFLIFLSLFLFVPTLPFFFSALFSFSLLLGLSF